MTAVLLDTNAAIWLAEPQRFDAEARRELDRALDEKRLWISPYSAWEMAVLVRKGRMPLNGLPLVWFENLLNRHDINLAPLDAGILAASQSLPMPFHDDPADRVIVATARHMTATLATSDQKIIAYAALGHVRVLPC